MPLPPDPRRHMYPEELRDKSPSELLAAASEENDLAGALLREKIEPHMPNLANEDLKAIRLALRTASSAQAVAARMIQHREDFAANPNEWYRRG